MFYNCKSLYWKQVFIFYLFSPKHPIVKIIAILKVFIYESLKKTPIFMVLKLRFAQFTSLNMFDYFVF